MSSVNLVLYWLVIVFVNCSAVSQPHRRSYLAWVFQQHKSSTWAPTVVAAPMPPSATLKGMIHSDIFFLPDVIVWDPLKQYPSILNSNPETLTICYEEGCGLPLKFQCWQDASNPQYTPRCLYGVNGFILLCQILTCPHYHCILVILGC